MAGKTELNHDDSNRPLRVLGIDPGLRVTGYGVVEFDAPDQLTLIEGGVLRGGPSDQEIGQRLVALRDGLADVLQSLKPHVVAMEDLYSHYERPKTAILMGHARGVLCMTAAAAGCAVHHYAATQIKRVLTGNGRAPKSQMQSAVARLLHLEEVPEPADVADALAIAVCHCFLGERAVATTGNPESPQPGSTS
ncbi:MAG: crossover junction endodeoxyribonuclease RuvC [Pirellulaceae bacterium]